MKYFTTCVDNTQVVIYFYLCVLLTIFNNCHKMMLNCYRYQRFYHYVDECPLALSDHIYLLPKFRSAILLYVGTQTHTKESNPVLLKN